jgi:hypothetical protein
MEYGDYQITITEAEVGKWVGEIRRSDGRKVAQGSQITERLQVSFGPISDFTRSTNERPFRSSQ